MKLLVLDKVAIDNQLLNLFKLPKLNQRFFIIFSVEN